MKAKQATQKESWLKTAITDGRKELKKLQDTDMHEILVKYVSDKIQSSVEKWFEKLEIARQPLNDSSFSNYLISNTAAYHTTISTESLISEYGMLHHSYDDLVDEIGKDGTHLSECERTINNVIPGINVKITDVMVKMDTTGLYPDVTFAVTILHLDESPVNTEHFSGDKCYNRQKILVETN